MSDTRLHPLIEAIVAPTQQAKAGALERFCHSATYEQLLDATRTLHEFGQDANGNVYQRVRALLQVSAIYRYFLPARDELGCTGHIPYRGSELVMSRRFNEAIDVFLAAATEDQMSDPLASALASAYYGLGFKLLAQQVQKAVRSMRGNRWMFRVSHALDYPLRVSSELVQQDARGLYPLLVEKTPVRLDLTHSGWSDIFFLAMDYPEGARVLNISVNLAPHGDACPPVPPISCYLRVIEEPVLRLTSVDLRVTADLTDIAEVFDFARDHLGLLKAAVIASGIIPPALEGSGQSLSLILERLVGTGLGLELVSEVNNIPKGSRLAVSTNLLSGLISICMRATKQVASLSGELLETEKRMVSGRAIFGEWLGGSGGGWQDSGGIWPGIKIIEGCLAEDGDVEYGNSRGRLLPRYTLIGDEDLPESIRKKLQDSLVIVHGGMAANVGPILEMVTEKFLLGTTRAWLARQNLLDLFDSILDALRAGDIREFGRLATDAFRGPLQEIIPWASNYYTERLIEQVSALYGARFWGFWMLGGMSGGGMGFIFDPAIKQEAEVALLACMQREKEALETSLPFAMNPVVYRFAINRSGTRCEVLHGDSAILSSEYYLLMLPIWLQKGSRSFSPVQRRELERFIARDLRGSRAEWVGQSLIRRLFPTAHDEYQSRTSLDELLQRNGFDPERHDRIRQDMAAGRISIAKNRLPLDTSIEDVRLDDVMKEEQLPSDTRSLGERALMNGDIAVVTLAAGAGSRWTQGAGTVKALHPFAKLAGKFRTFIEVHLAKSRMTERRFCRTPVHVFTTSYLTHDPIRRLLERERNYGYPGDVRLSPGQSIGLRLVPSVRDLQFAWEQTPQQQLEERKQKVRDNTRVALMQWATSTGEVSDYRDNVPAQCIHPVGHWYEVANLLLNGTLSQLLAHNGSLKYLLLHNIDTLGAQLDPLWLGQHIASGAMLTFEVVPRRFEDRGGGLARVRGCCRLVEGLAFPREEDEAKLSYYNSLTTWISIDALLTAFGLSRDALHDQAKVRRGVRDLSDRLPTYVTLKDVKRRWGNAQEDIFPVAQFEKLWGDMSAIPGIDTRYFLVNRRRGQQLKDVAQLDTWVRDGSREYVESLCAFD